MKEKIVYNNKEEFLKKLEKIKNGWIENLHILSDFDRTLTKCFTKWKKRPSLIWVMRQWDYLWEEYSKKAHDLFNHYNPIEINPDIELWEKKNKMIEWWTKHLNLLIESKLNKKDIEDIINSWIIELREWNNDFFNNIKYKQTPLIIISANWLWWDSIKLFFENNNLLDKNISIISNEFLWDEKKYAKWYKETIIHTFNKSETVIKDKPDIYKKIKNRKNVILLWDSLWDPNMIDWFEYDNIISIWFLNKNEDELMKDYKKVYDIIITWDWSFKIINEILENIK